MIISKQENFKIYRKLVWQAMKLVWQKPKLVGQPPHQLNRKLHPWPGVNTLNTKNSESIWGSVREEVRREVCMFWVRMIY